MATKDSRRSYVTFTGATKDGTTVADTAPDAHADSTSYTVGEMVSFTGETLLARCTVAHTSASSGGLTLSAGSLGGTDAANWELVPAGNFARVVSWTINETSTTNTYTASLNDTADTTYSSQRTDTITLVGEYDPEENIQKVFTVGTVGTLDIYVQGRAAGLPIWRASVTVGSFDSASNTETPVQFTANLTVGGSGIDRTVTQV